MSVRIITGDCREVLPTLPADSFDCVVTSPPYFGLRDYGVEGQIGLEPTLALYLETMVGVFRELRRVLKPSGCAFLNIGDSYCSTAPGTMGDKLNQRGIFAGVSDRRAVAARKFRHETPFGMKPKDLMMVPNRLAILLQDDGWYVRSEIIWHKPNPMPESVTDRPTCAHEKVWLLTRSERYFYDADAIAEPSCAEGRPQRARAKQLAKDAGLTDRHIAALKACGVSDVGKAQTTQSGFGKNDAEVMRLAVEAKAALGGYTREFLIAETINARNVWSIASEPYRGAHYAVMPSTLAERCIKAGSSEKGCCPRCGKPWERITEEGARQRIPRYPNDERLRDTKMNGPPSWKTYLTVGWQPTCSCVAHEPVPATILDCFGGAGTTGLVADRLGRHATLIELNPAHRELGAERVRMDGPLFAEVSA